MKSSIAIVRGEEKEHAMLTAEIATVAFGVTPDEHKELKGLKRENLRDHMTDLELIFSMLGDAATTEITRIDNAQGFAESRAVARKGVAVAGVARKDLERKTGKRVVSVNNLYENAQSIITQSLPFKGMVGWGWVEHFHPSLCQRWAWGLLARTGK